MQDPNSLKSLFQRMAAEPMAVIRGKVVSVQPLQIQASGDQKLLLSRSHLCLPRHLPELEEGDEVYLLSFNHGKKYFVLGCVQA